jgi:hypothetical protein
MTDAAHETRLARVLGVPLAEDAVRQWPQSVKRYAAASESLRWSPTSSDCGSEWAGDTSAATPWWSSGARITAMGGRIATSPSPSFETDRRQR